MLFYARPSRVYGSKARIGNSNKFERQTFGNQPVGMVLLDQRTVAAARSIERHPAFKTQNGIRIALATLHMPDRDAVEGNLVKAENTGDFG